MTNLECIADFYLQVKKSIQDGSFAKLTLAKTIGNPLLMNIYVRAIVDNEKIAFELKYKFQQEEKIEIYSIDEGLQIVTPYFGNPFQSMLLFTTQNDITLKINKKRDYKLHFLPPTFKNPSEVLKDFYLI